VTPDSPWSRRIALAAAALASVAVLCVGIRYGTFAAADNDPYGYVSEADAIDHGTLRLDQQFARAFDWPHAELTFCPPGWRPAAVRGYIVPIYPSGLPFVMASVQRIAGRLAIYYVVPVLGALTVWLTVLVGARVHNPLTGALAALLVASSPIFLYQLVQPVSDVAAAFWWLLVLTLAVRRTRAASAAAGLAASMAIVTRPNLVPLAIVPAAFLASPRIWSVDRDGRGAIRCAADFALATVPGCLVVAALNQYLHGSPLESGYWQQSELFAWSHVVPNLARYPRWLLETQTPFIFVGLFAPAIARRDAIWLLWTFTIGVILSYLFYAPFGLEEWGYVRFLLPAFPPLLILSVAAIVDLLARTPMQRAGATIAVALVCGALVVWQGRQAIHRGAFTLQLAERRYVDVGTYIGRMMPSNAIFIAAAQSGSIRYYSNRLTVRFDLLEPHRLDYARLSLGAQGFHTYLALEEDEERQFRDRFGAFSEIAALDWPPIVERSEPVRVRIYDPADRQRFLAGEALGTSDIDLTKKPTLTRKKP
jgi:hypothetical protein